ALAINTMLAGNQVTGADRDNLKAAAALFASILWDEDFVPLTAAEANLGTANMPIQYVQYRNMYALLMGQIPLMAGHLAEVAGNTQLNFQGEINEYGAHRASPHYVEASQGPLLSVAQQLQLNGVDLAVKEPRIAKFAEFYMNLLTPPEVRFGGLRKLVSIGDGSTESS